MMRPALLSALVALAFCISEMPSPARAQAPVPALVGNVSSDAEGPMEGVVVSAKKVGSTITVSVISDEQGRYQFPASRLVPGQYSLKIRAVGYVIDGSGSAEVAVEKTSIADLKLKKTKNLAAQLTNAEWLLSIPGTDDQKRALLDCNACHTYERIVRSTHDAEEWAQVVWRMRNYAFQSQPIKPVPRMDPGWGASLNSIARSGNISPRST